MILSGDRVRVSLNLKVRLPPDPFQLLVAVDQQLLLLPNGGREKYFRHS